MKRLFLAINNRMYCEYYKLYKIIADYVKEYIEDKKTLEIVKVTSFPVYKDLEPYKKYNFEIIQEIHENIILLLYGINEFIMNKETELDNYQKKQASGLNINNFVTTFNYNILITKEKGLLFISYIDFFHTLHTKYLQRFAMKMNLMYSQVTHDIHFDDTSKIINIKKNELIDNFKNDQIDNSLIKQIRSSFDDSETNSNDSPNSSSLTNSHNENELTINNVYSKNKNDTGIETTINNKSIFKNIFGKNVEKIVGGMFKTKKKDVNNNLETISSDSMKNNIEQMELLNYKKMVSSRDLSTQSKVSTKSNPIKDNVIIKIHESQEKCIPILINPMTTEDSVELKNALSQDHMFLELTKQCNEITNVDLENVKKYINLENKEQIYNDYFIQGESLDRSFEERIVEMIVEDVEEQNEDKHTDDNMSIITIDSGNIKNKEVKTEEVKTEEATVEEVKIEEVIVEEVKTEEVQKQEEQKKRSYKPKKKK